MTKSHSCIVCGNNETQKEIFSCNDYLYSNDFFAITECPECGFRTTLSPPNEDNIGKYYESSEYVSHSNSQVGLTHRLYHIVRKYMLKKKAKMVKKQATNNGHRILDIGSGTGHFLHQMQESGWQCKGIEVNQSAADFSRTEFSLDICPSIETIREKVPSEKYNIITLWHVFEHLYDLPTKFQTFDDLLHDDGCLVIAVPNCSSFDANHYKNNWAAYDVPRHLWHFTPETLSHFAMEHGFEVKKTSPLLFDSFYISILSEKIKRGKGNFILAMFFGGISFLRALFNKNRCSSVVYYLRKKR